MSLGIDIVKNDRIRKAVEKYGERFLKRIYTQEELAYCSQSQNFYECLSARWACKEAVIKAVYQKTGLLLRFSEIEVLGNRGKPATVRLLREELKSLKLLVSISHEREYSVAVAIIWE
ncbi:holo-ACP synthase [Thermocrinis minervae]|uniref:Holo-[acyl-carrier-protein] synthase n=1 Tax=Thermocrinis minervae TaxID=381751 RepID=A0A1M6T4B3_9AQUI|nr:holo-ACP synthase [Thermocrinis minervae]SHK51791.1 holo-[acyl-carrier protein] synthase [Thermocrinis minervae]